MHSVNSAICLGIFLLTLVHIVLLIMVCSSLTLMYCMTSLFKPAKDVLHLVFDFYTVYFSDMLSVLDQAI